jgi:hypothetical protein
MTTTFLNTFAAARRVSTPLVAVQTADPAATVQALRESMTEQPPMLLWDIVRGMQGVNDAGRAAFDELGIDPLATTNLVDALGGAGAKLPEDAVLFVANAQSYIRSTGVPQAIWNLRDPFKSTGRTLVLLAPPSGIQLPPELQQDVFIMDEPLPTSAELATIIRETYSAADLTAPANIESAVDAVIGLAAFPAEQVCAMSLTTEGLDVKALWERKRQVIEQAPGLSVWRGGETFKDVGGCDNVKSFLTAALNGEEAPRVVVFIDEIEKALAGAAGGGADSSGVSQEMLGALLTEMQDQQYTGCIFIGPPGAAKSAIAKATGAEANIPTIAFDLSAMKGSLVGQSGEQLRAALKVVRAVSQGRALFIATCNKIANLPPELRRRFTFGTFFFDLPSAAERAGIWKLYQEKFAVTGDVPEDEGWTGAEIRQCCVIARRLRITLRKAATYIVPVAKSAAADIERLRTEASGKFVSASYEGVYRADAPAAPSAPARRKLAPVGPLQGAGGQGAN